MTEQLALDFAAHGPRPLVLGEYEAFILRQLEQEPCPFDRSTARAAAVSWDRMLDDLRAGEPHQAAVGRFHAATRTEVGRG